jgi:hypothetical protein
MYELYGEQRVAVVNANPTKGDDVFTCGVFVLLKELMYANST